MLTPGWWLGLAAVIIFAVFVIGIMWMMHRTMKQLNLMMRSFFSPFSSILKDVESKKHDAIVKKISSTIDNLLNRRKSRNPKLGTQFIGEIIEWGMLGLVIWKGIQEAKQKK